MNQKSSIMAIAQDIIKRLKPYLRWAILGGTLFFLAQTLKSHWQDVAAIRIDMSGWACLAIALGTTLLAHIWSGWVWSWILRELNQPASGVWGVLIYLKTNIAKYLPGNVWHFYGRVWAAKSAGLSGQAATVSVLLEPLLMAASALLVALLSGQRTNWILQVLSLVGVLGIVHPISLNWLLAYVGKLKGTLAGDRETASPTSATGFQSQVTSETVRLRRYPLIPLVGELMFLALRSTGFLWVVLALGSMEATDVPILVSAFSFAWLLGLVVPGAPGGIGVFEATAVALLDGQYSAGFVLTSVALYRLVSTLAEAGGAGLAWLDERWNPPVSQIQLKRSGNLES
jgi:uncharacterized membrane protein YbhN (UPF0104 family)